MQINGYEFLKKYISDWIWIWIKHAHNVTRLTRKFMPCQNSGRRGTPFGLRVVEQWAWEGMQKPEGHVSLGGITWKGVDSIHLLRYIEENSLVRFLNVLQLVNQNRSCTPSIVPPPAP